MHLYGERGTCVPSRRENNVFTFRERDEPVYLQIERGNCVPIGRERGTYVSLMRER